MTWTTETVGGPRVGTRRLRRRSREWRGEGVARGDAAGVAVCHPTPRPARRSRSLTCPPCSLGPGPGSRSGSGSRSRSGQRVTTRLLLSPGWKPLPGLVEAAPMPELMATTPPRDGWWHDHSLGRRHRRHDCGCDCAHDGGHDCDYDHDYGCDCGCGCGCGCDCGCGYQCGRDCGCDHHRHHYRDRSSPPCVAGAGAWTQEGDEGWSRTRSQKEAGRIVRVHELAARTVAPVSTNADRAAPPRCPEHAPRWNVRRVMHAKQSKAKQSKAKQSKAKQSKAKQSKAKQSKARSSYTRTNLEQPGAWIHAKQQEASLVLAGRVVRIPLLWEGHPLRARALLCSSTITPHTPQATLPFL